MFSMTSARYHETEARTLTRVSGVADPWFLGRYGMNLYRGCEHGCLYCDGRAERYRVDGDFARDIRVKHNAVALLSRELGRIREPGFVFVGGGVSDAYQPAEARFGLARGALEVTLERGLPVHVLTKSALVERDLELLCAIHETSAAILSFSILGVDEALRERFEPGAAPFAERWRLIERAKTLGLYAGVMAMPVLPGLSDSAQDISRLVRRAADAGADFVLCGGLTLRPGVQRRLFFDTLRDTTPALLPGYRRVYRQRRPSGAAAPRYDERLDARFREARARYGVPGRPLHRIYRGRVPRYTEAAIRLEHQAFEEQRPPSWARAAWALQKWARTCLTRNRRRSYTYRDVEAECAVRLADGSLVTEAGIPETVLPALREIWSGPGLGTAPTAARPA